MNFPVHLARLICGFALICTYGTPTPLHAQTRDVNFGEAERIEGALIGILYDLKITQNREPTDMNANKYTAVADEFLASGWDENVLKNYYRATRPLYATQLFIPMISANSAPQAFNVQDVVKPRLWMVHYKGQVRPPHAGRFRFAGYADDVIAVAVNGKTVLVAGRPEIDKLTKTGWRSSEPKGPKVANGQMFYGDWLDLAAGEALDLDILIGERPGGQFLALLYWQEEGVDYEQANGGPVLPAFQLAPGALPKNLPTATNAPYWQAVP